MTRIYLSSGYIDEDYICGCLDTFIFQVGPRGTGKSYGILQWILKNDLKFILLRRTQTEADAIGTALTNPFKAIMRDFPALDVQISSVRKNVSAFSVRMDSEGEYKQSGYLCSLSTFATIKGMDLSDVDVIFYDEFIPERHQRPIKDEYTALMNVYESVNRNRELQGRKPCKLICAANSTDIANPIFIGLEIVDRIARQMQKGIEVYRDPERRLAIYMFMHSPISGEKAQTALYRLTAGSDFQNMAIRNMFDIDQRYIKSLPLKEYKPVCRFGELVIYQHKSRSEYYARCGAAGTVPAVYTTSDTDKKRFIKRFNYLYLRYLSGYMFFERVTAQVLFERIFI
jgi:hypothetical protein